MHEKLQRRMTSSGNIDVTYVVDGPVVAAQDEEGTSGVVAADGNHVLVLQRPERPPEPDWKTDRYWSNGSKAGEPAGPFFSRRLHS